MFPVIFSRPSLFEELHQNELLLFCELASAFSRPKLELFMLFSKLRASELKLTVTATHSSQLRLSLMQMRKESRFELRYPAANKDFVNWSFNNYFGLNTHLRYLFTSGPY